MRRPFLTGGVLLEATGLLMIAVAPTPLVVLVSWCLVAIGPAAVLTAANAVILPDRRLDPQQPLPSYSIGEFLRSFWVNPRRYPDFGWAWLGRFLVVMGMATLTTYQVYYLIDHLHVSLQEVAGLIFLLILISNIAIMVASQVSGWFSDKVRRRKPFVLLSAIVYALGLLLVALAPSITAFLIGIASTVPNTVAPAMAPLFLAIGGGGNYTALFLAAAVFALLGALYTQPIKGVH